MDMNLSRLWDIVKDKDFGVLLSMGLRSWTQLSDRTTTAEEKFHDPGLGYSLLDMALKVQATEEKTDKLTSSRLKTFVVSKNNMIRSGTFRVRGP